MPTNDQLLQFQTIMYLYINSGLKKYDQDIYTAIMELFNTMPISAIVDNKYLCVHGGITSALTSVIHSLISLKR